MKVKSDYGIIKSKNKKHCYSLLTHVEISAEDPSQVTGFQGHFGNTFFEKLRLSLHEKSPKFRVQFQLKNLVFNYELKN